MHDGNKNVTDVIAASTAATQLAHYNYRHYGPTMGRWLSRDPIEERGGLMLYGYFAKSIGNDYCGMFWAGEQKDILYFPIDFVNLVLSAKDCLIGLYNWSLNMRQHSKGADNDKFLHCIASCEFSYNCGVKVSALIGIIKEEGDVIGNSVELVWNLLFNDRNSVSDDFEWWWKQIVDSRADLLADGIGIGCNLSGADCECCCAKKYNKYGN